MLARSGLPKRPLHALGRSPLQSQYAARASDELRSWTIFFIVPHLPLQNGNWSSPNTVRNDCTRSCLAVSLPCSWLVYSQHVYQLYRAALFPVVRVVYVLSS